MLAHDSIALGLSFQLQLPLPPEHKYAQTVSTFLPLLLHPPYLFLLRAKPGCFLTL